MNDFEAQKDLQAEEDRLREVRNDLRNQADEELSTVEQHSSDAGNEQLQREVDMTILEQVESELDDVERALRKLEQGEYGVCEVCGEQIAEERLKAQPATRFCTEHADSRSQQVG